jgi:hypothetical protein
MITMLAILLSAAMFYLWQRLGGRKVRNRLGKVCLHAPLGLMIALMIALSFGADAVARELKAPPAPGELAIVGARIYPAPDAAPIDDGVVIVRGGQIVSVGSRSETAVPRAARLIDARGSVLTAGFWNSHIHLITPAC